MISVIILVHNKLELTQRCLSALSAAVSEIEHEIVCVDNASTDDVRSLQEYAPNFRRLRFIRNEQNLSFAIANNRTAKDCIGNHLLFLNNDVIVSRSSVHALLDAITEETDRGITGAKLVYPTRKVQHAGIAQMLWGYVSNFGAGGDRDDARFAQKCERFAVTGAMACLPRTVFEKVGGFDERYRWGYEDVDLCLKVRAAGLHVVYVPNAESIHEESATLSTHRNPSDLEHNYRTYRSTWGSELSRREQAYLKQFQQAGVRRVVLLGTGRAAYGLYQRLSESGIETLAFTSTQSGGLDTFYGRPVVTLDSLRTMQFDRLVVASQYFFEFEKEIKRYDPTDAPIFPALL